MVYQLDAAFALSFFLFASYGILLVVFAIKTQLKIDKSAFIVLTFYFIYFSLLTFNWLGLFIKNNYFFGNNNVNWSELIGYYFIIMDAVIYFMITVAHTFFIFEMLFVKSCLHSSSLEEYKKTHVRTKKIRTWVMITQIIDYIAYAIMFGFSLFYPDIFLNNFAISATYTLFKFVGVVIDFALLILFVFLVVFYVKMKRRMIEEQKEIFSTLNKFIIVWIVMLFFLTSLSMVVRDILFLVVHML